MVARASGLQTLICWGAPAAACVEAEASCRHIDSNGGRAGRRARAHYGLTGSYGGPVCWHAFLWMHSIPLGVPATMESNYKDLAGGVQVHIWRASLYISTLMSTRVKRSTQFQPPSSCQGHGCQCALLWLYILPPGIHTGG